MSKISDELRRQANCIRSLNSKTHTYKDPCKIERLADCIDAEMVELPKDADGRPIHVGDTVYGCRSGMKMTISELRMTADGWSISTSRGYLTDAEVTHTRPDSWERIADELEAWCDDADVDGDACEKPRDLAERIRKLRELVRVFYHCTTSGVCDECPVNGGGTVHLMPDTICDTMHDRMRELGVDA